jgi:hypothetical protein
VVTLSADSSGVSAGLTLSGGPSVNVDDLIVNAQGISGHFYIGGLSATNSLSATIAGFTVALTAFDITLAQGGLAASNIAAQLTIPFFTDSSGNPQVVDIEVSTDAKGNLTISVAAAPSQSTTPDGLVQLMYELTGVGSVEIDVDSLKITEVNSVWTLLISGNLIIETEGLSWPAGHRQQGEYFAAGRMDRSAQPDGAGFLRLPRRPAETRVRHRCQWR